MRALHDFFRWAEQHTNLERINTPQARQHYHLHRMRVLAAACDNPHHAYKVIHIAGSKGKGSTALLTARIVANLGYTVGCYLSPHVQRYTERFVRFPAESTDARLLHTAQYVRETIERALPTSDPPTTFEILTIFAFCYFRAAGCQWAVIECGLGGRLDATNIVTPAITAITPLEIEHSDYLGATIESIAREKGGIIKPPAPLILAPQPQRARRLLHRIAHQAGITTHYMPTHIRRTAITRALRTHRITIHPLASRAPLTIPVICSTRWQIENIALATLIASHIFPTIAPADLASISHGAGLAGRFELLRFHPPIIADGAHTPRSLEATVTAFARHYTRQGIVVFGCNSDKNYRRMLAILAGHFAHYIFVHRPDKSVPSHHLAQAARRHIPARKIEQTPLATVYHTAVSRAAHRPILICGSLYLIGDIKNSINSQQADMLK